MGRPGVQVWTWTLCVLFSSMCVARGPQYMVAIPAVLEAGAVTRFCMSLMKPNETLEMTITLVCPEKNTTLLKKSSSEEFHDCMDFKVPLVQSQEVYNFEVEVKGDTFSSKEVRKVMVKFSRPITFIQTDKPIYLPGQTVNFRVVTLDSRMRPAPQLYDLIEVEDANNNRVAQWLNKTADSSILQLSYTLNSEAKEGFYQVIVTMNEIKIRYSFTVEKYVLPKFDTTLTIDESISVEQEEIKAELCAKYTYGQPVPGSGKVKICRPYNHFYFPIISQDPVPCHELTNKMDKKGCATFIFKMSSFSRLDTKVVQDFMDVVAEVEEEGTGISRLQTKRPQISYVIGKLTFINMPKIYDKGSDLKVQVKAVHFNDTPIANMDVYIFEGVRWSSHLVQNLTTNSDGLATFSLSTAEFEGDINLHVGDTPILSYAAYRTPYYETGHYTVSMFQPVTPNTKTISSLEVVRKDNPLSCDTNAEISIKYTVVGENQGSMVLIYLVLSRGAIYTRGTKQIELEDIHVTEGKIAVELKVHAGVAPHIQVLAYAVLPSEDVIAHSADFSVEKCFSHKVALEFRPSSAVPGEDITMQLTAQPDSLCGVSAVDQSVLIKNPDKKLTADKIFDLLHVTKVSHIPYELYDQEECLRVRPKRYIMPYPIERNDAYTIFQNVGIKMATNLFIRMPQCLNFRGREYHQGHIGIAYNHVPVAARMETRLLSAPGGAAGPVPGPPIIETVRTFFPETWIWDLVEVGGFGTKDVFLTVPDTITTWETEAFCLSPLGFGLAPRKEITVFQPFFLELTLPYSVIRGEQFVLKATVFNYLSSCIMVSVVPTISSDYTLTPLSGDKYTSCLCGNERKTLSWDMSPKTLGVVNVTVTAEAVASHASCDNEIVAVPDRGRIDVVTRSLIVKVEGTEIRKTHNLLLCPKGDALTEEIELTLDPEVIVGSDRASLSVLGDILGRALKNLDGLLRMPYGCGEQNMALLAPNIYILQYLKNTQQLTQAIKEKSANFLSSGYQRQLNYKHPDGAFSTFGTGTGNTWLTAFVLRSFTKAKSFTYIDPEVIESSKIWLERKQLENGCFQQLGRLFNNRMKGGVSDEVTLTAYITAAFLEMNSSLDDDVMKKSLSCLKGSASNFSNTYTTALMAYVFTLAGDMETRANLLQHLHDVAHKEGGVFYWSQTATETSASLSVEISSYVMLAKLSARPTAEDLGYSSRIVKWLTAQQNYYGGFSSTQDTVVALQALALYSTLVFSPDGSSTVTVQTPSDQLSFDVNKDNKLLYQEKMLQDTHGKYLVKVEGDTCASVQISLHYNIPVVTDDTVFSVDVKAEPDCPKNKFTLLLKCQYRGKEITTNMMILDIKILSGFIIEPDHLRRFRGSLLVERVEEKEDHIMVYIKGLPREIPINYSLNFMQQLPVQNLKPATIKLYDYYQPSDQVETEYIHPCPAA